MTNTTMSRRYVTVLLAVTAVAAFSAATVFASAPAMGAAPRGYELVSPTVKGGGDVLADTSRTRAAVSGDAIAFTSLTAFGDAVGTGISTEYISQRSAQAGTSGWVTHAITPQANALSVVGAGQGHETAYQSEFSSDLNRAIVRSYTPLTNDPNVATVSNSYLRSDALTAGAGSYTLLSACPACTSALSDPFGAYRQFVADSTPDLGVVLFEAKRQLTPDAPPQSAACLVGSPFSSPCNPSLYEWDHGTLRFEGILPNGTAAPISIASIGAAQERYTFNTISDDGRKVFFTVPPTRSGLSGDLYMRVDHTSTVQLNASERTDCADHDPCSGTPEPDPAGAQPANFAIPSPDGSKVFFSSPEQLTDTPGGTLYVYDTTLPASDPHNLQHVYNDQQPDDGSGGDGPPIGTSGDGSYLYFTYPGALLPGQTPLPDEGLRSIYVWHEGTLTFVGSIDPDAAALDSPLRAWAIGSGQMARVSPDGHTLLFTSFTGIGLPGHYDHGTACGGAPCAELYLFSTLTNTTRCVSCNPSGATATAGASFDAHFGIGTSRRTSHLNHPLSDDGQHVFFETSERLLPQVDTNGTKTDVYEYDATDSSLHLISSGSGPNDSHFLDASPATGRDVFFTTTDRLNGWDTDNNADLYDARAGGGLPDPAVKAAACAADACQGIVQPRDDAAQPAISVLAGSGNIDHRAAGGGKAVIIGLSRLSLADRARLAGGGVARLSVRVNQTGTVTVSGTARIAGKSRRVISSAAQATKAGTVSVGVTLTHAARAELRRKRSLSVTVTIRFNNARPRVLTLALKAPAAKKATRS